MKEEEHRDQLVDMLLRELVGKETPPHVKTKVLERINASTPSLKLAPNLSTQAPLPVRNLPTPKTSHSSPWKKFAIAATITALLAIPAFFYHLSMVADRTPLITLSEGSVKPDSGQLLIGKVIETGSKSAAILTWPDGTTVKIGANTRLQPINKSPWDYAKTLKLQNGTLHAKVSPQKTGAPLGISTSHSLTEVLGTSFSLSHTDNSTRIEVDSGKIRFTPTGSHPPLLLEKGSFAEASAEKPPLHGPVAEKPTQGISGFILINADTNKPIKNKILRDNEIISLSSLPSPNINLRTEFTGSTPTRMLFFTKKIQGNKIIHIKKNPENSAPFFSFGDFSSVGRPNHCRPWSPSPGTYRITAYTIHKENDSSMRDFQYSIDITFIK